MGDSAYPLTDWLLTPFSSGVIGNPDGPRARYNRKHILTRTHVERAFGSLKKRFYSLATGLRVKDMAFAAQLAICAVILHNLAVRAGDLGEAFENEAQLPSLREPNVPEGIIQVGPVRERRRNEIVNYFTQPRPN